MVNDNANAHLISKLIRIIWIYFYNNIKINLLRTKKSEKENRFICICVHVLFEDLLREGKKASRVIHLHTHSSINVEYIFIYFLAGVVERADDSHTRKKTVFCRMALIVLKPITHIV